MLHRYQYTPAAAKSQRKACFCLLYTSRRDGRYIEQVGSYDPMKEGVNYTINLEKVDKWLANGAQPSETRCV